MLRDDALPRSALVLEQKCKQVKIICLSIII